MAFENIGIGGVLSFESRGAVANMENASRAFNSMHGAAARFSAGMGNVASGLRRLSVGGGIIGMLGGLSFGALLHEGIAFNQMMQSATLSVATILSAVTKTPLADNIELAGKEMTKLNIIAAETPGELGDVIDIFSRLTGPILAAGGDMKTLEDTTKATAIMAGTLHLDFKQTAHAMSLLAGGTMRHGENLIQMLHSMGLLHESTQEWKALLPEQRLKRIKEIMDAFGASGERVGQTFEAQYSTVKSIAKVLLGAFTKGAFENAAKRFGVISKAFFENQDAAVAFAASLGTGLTMATEFLVSEFIDLGHVVMRVWRTMNGFFHSVQDRIESIGYVLDMDVIKRIAHIAFQFVAVSVAASPILAIVGGIGTRIAAVAQIALGLGQIILSIGQFILAGLSLPLLGVGAVIFGVFMAFRRDGESVMETLQRGFEMLRAGALAVWDAVQLIGPYLVSAFHLIVDSLSALWIGIQPGLAMIGQALVKIGQMVVEILAAVMPVIGRIIVGAVQVFEVLRPGLEAVFNAVAKIVLAVVNALSVLLPKLLPIIRPIVDILLKLAVVAAAVISKIFEVIGPILESIANMFTSYVLPVLSWVLDTFGPVLSAAFQLVGDVLNIVMSILSPLIDAISWVIDKVGGPFTDVWNAVGEVFQWLGDIIQKYIIEPLKDAFGWVVKIIGGVADAVSEVSDYLGDGTMAGKEEAKAEQVTKQLEWMNAHPEYQAGFSAVDQALKASGYNPQLVDEDTTGDGVDMSPAAVAARKAKWGVVNTDVTQNVKTTPDVNVSVDVNNKTDLCVDGRKMSAATARHETEINERSGFSETPWQTRRVQVTGTRTKQ